MRPRALLPVAILTFGVALSAIAQSNAALMESNRYTRAHDYDLIHQRIVLSRFNWDSSSFDGSVTSTIVSRRPGLSAVMLDEGRLLVNTSTTDRGGRALAATHRADSLVVTPSKPLKLGDTLIFTVRYHGRVRGGHGLTFLTNDGLTHRPDQIWSQGEDSDNRYWFPTYDAPNDKMTWELVASVPKHDLAISNGRLVSNVVAGAVRTMSWSQEAPASSYLVSLVVAPLALVHDSWHGVPVDYYTYHEDSTRAWPLFHVTVDMIDTYSRLTGVDYPWAKYAQSTVADFFGGMENVSATTLVDWLPDPGAYRDRPWYQHVLIPHELAHQWFGDYVTTANWANMWLNEGFAEFMPGQYWKEKLGARTEQDYYVDEYHQYMAVENQRSMPLASLGSNNIYPKGALVIKMLKDYLGADRFWASVHSYLTQHAFGNAISDDMRKAVQTATGENLDWFWNEWMYGAGLPRIAVTSSYDAATSRLTLSVKQTQVDSFKVDSTGRLFSVPQAFRMPITIRVGTRNGDIVHAAELNTREQTILIDGVSSEPTMVVFDDGNRMLKTLTFEQPVRWLAEQLRRGTSLWDKEWAIQQLARQPSDTAAATALSEAATHADYPLTRAQATEALADFGPVLAANAVTAALRDTAASVRTAAATALEKMGDASAAALARNAFDADSSYEVRAAALLSAAHLEPARAHELIGRGLATASYRDAILNAALQAVVQLNDTGYVERIEAATGQLEYPMHVLAILGARGNARAMNLATAHLDDSRTAMRRWAVNAFRNTMPRVDKGVTLDRLRLTLPRLTHADTRQQVVELIASLQKP